MKGNTRVNYETAFWATPGKECKEIDIVDYFI